MANTHLTNNKAILASATTISNGALDYSTRFKGYNDRWYNLDYQLTGITVNGSNLEFIAANGLDDLSIPISDLLSSSGNTLQIVTDNGNTTTNTISLQSSAQLTHSAELIIAATTNVRNRANIHTFDNSAGSTEYARFDSSGRLGIGTASPIGKLFIGSNWRTTYGGTNLYVGANGTNITSTSDLGITYSISDATVLKPNKVGLTLYNDDTTVGGWSPLLLFSKAESGASNYKATMAGIAAKSPTGTGDGGNWIDGELHFYTAGAATSGIVDRMIIDKDGNVGIGTTSPSTKLDVDGVITATGGNSTNWNTAYNDKINSAAFNTSDGILTLTQQDGGTVTVDLDGRYLTSETDSQTLTWTDGTNNLAISGGNSVTITGFADAAHTHTTSDITNLSSYTGFDTRYYTEAEVENGFLSTAFLSTRSISNADSADVKGVSFYYLTSGALNKPTGADHALFTQAYSTLWATQMASDWRTNKWYVRTQENTVWKTWQELFTDLYHPNADTWTTSRTLSIGGTGKSVDGSGNVTWSTTEIGITKANIDALNIDADTLDGQNGTYYLDYNNLTNTPTYDNYNGWDLDVGGISRGTIISGENVGFAASTGINIAFNTVGNLTTYSLDTSYVSANYAALSHIHSTSDITSGTFADARVAQSNVTQHQSALSIVHTQLTGFNLVNLTDTTIPTLDASYDGAVLAYDNTSSKWVPTTGLNLNILLDDLSDIDVGGAIDGSILRYNIVTGLWYDSSPFIEVAAGTGLSGGGYVSPPNTVTLNLDLNELSNSGTLVGTDYIASVDGTASRKSQISSIPLSIFNNDLSIPTVYNSNITITAGVGLSGGGVFTTNQSFTEEIILTVDLNELTTSTTNGDGDYFAVIDTGGNAKKLTKGNIALSGFNNDLVNNSTITINAGANLKTGGDFTINQGSNETITIDFDNSQTLEMGASLIMKDGHSVNYGTGGDIRQYYDATSESLQTEFRYSTASYWDITDGTNPEFRFYVRDTAKDGQFHADGDIVSFSSSIASDGRLKNTVKKYKNALNDIMALNPVRFKWNRSNKDDLGFIAQEVEQVLPTMVHTGIFDTDYKSLKYNNLVAVLTRGMQEQQLLIEEMKEELQDLRNRFNNGTN